MSDDRRDKREAGGQGAEKRSAKDGENQAVDTLFVELRALAREIDAERSAMPSSFASPLSQKDREGIADAILDAQAQAQGRGAPAPADRTLQHLQRRRRRWWPALVPLALAAGVALVLVPLRSDTPALPEYQVLASGGIAQFRSMSPPDHGPSETQAAPQVVDSHSELVVVARPVTTVPGPVAVRTFLVRDQRVREIDPVVMLAPSGAAQIRVLPAHLAGEAPGHGSLKVLVGRTTDVRSASLSDALTGAGAKRATRWLTVPLEFRGN